MRVNWHEFSCRSNKCIRQRGSISKNYVCSTLNKCSVLPVVQMNNQFQLFQNKLKLNLMMNSKGGPSIWEVRKSNPLQCLFVI
jgi:hypothetical protein